LTISILALYNI